MNISYKFIIIFIVLITTSASSQEKLKGNKIITLEDREISDFTIIEVIDEVDVYLIHNQNQSVTVQTDSNLQNAIITSVKDGVLSIRIDELIGRNKGLKVFLNVNKNITEINTYNNVTVTSTNNVVIESLSINAYDASKIDLKLNCKDLFINGKSSSNLNFEILSTTLTIHTEDSNKTNAEINTQNIILNTLDRSTLTLSGAANNLELTAYSSSTYKGENFVTKNAIVKANNSVNLYVHVTEKLELFSNNSSELHLYGNPEITIHEFFDQALIRKRELD